MIEKVNPSHPDKIADRIAGAIIDLAYKIETAPKIAVEVLIGHGKCHVIIETSASLSIKATPNNNQKSRYTAESRIPAPHYCRKSKLYQASKFFLSAR